MDGLPSLGAGELEREPHDLLAALARDQLQALRHPGRLHVLDPRVQVLDVLAHDDQVDAAPGVGRDDARQLPSRPDVPVGLEQLPQRHVGALLAVADRRLERALEDDPGARDRLDRLVGNARRQALQEDARARLALLPLDRSPGRLDDQAGGVDDLGADAVARDEGHELRFHELHPASVRDRTPEDVAQRRLIRFREPPDLFGGLGHHAQHALAKLETRRGEPESLHAAVVRRVPPLDEPARLEAIDDAGDVRRVAVHQAGEVAHRHWPGSLEQPEHVRLHESQIELLERVEKPPSVLHCEPEGDPPGLARRIVAHTGEWYLMTSTLDNFK